MKLTHCESCGKEISTLADKCPSCGGPNNWVHPIIKQFILSKDKTGVTTNFRFDWTRTSVWGWTETKFPWWLWPIILLSSIPGLAFGIIPALIIAPLTYGILLMMFGKKKEFKADLQAGTWQSSDDGFWRPVKNILFPCLVSDQTVIEFSKKRLLMLVVASLVFILGSVWMVIDTPFAHRTAHFGIIQLLYSKEFYVYVGIANIVLFSTVAVFGVVTLFVSRPGLVLTGAGFPIEAKTIPWSDISGFSIAKVNGQRILVVNILRPEKYIDGASWFRKFYYRMHIMMYGGLFSFGPGLLKISLDDLRLLCEDYLKRYGDHS